MALALQISMTVTKMTTKVMTLAKMGAKMMEKEMTHLGFLHVPQSKLAHHFLRSLNSNDC